ncbi:MAG: terminase [Sphingomonas bacterium]|uniref:terminase large subunit domain-containing protein n=1 Tax=Sphingomonas bacterium TaxID=1895847 RepID=UPI0026041E0E|nr:terminase family protein [Sphingomonas bacterium]MDB5704414.1 terminase [Sphingomonas bacterium]
MIKIDPAALKSLVARGTPQEQAQIEALIAADAAATPWRPQAGAQMQALESEAWITGYGGAAGGGKSDLIAGLALTRHRRSLILRREKAQTDGIVQRIAEILGSPRGHNAQKAVWRLPDWHGSPGPGRLIEFGGLANPGDHHKWQGRAHDLIAYDEATELREAQVRFTMGWARTGDAAQRARIVMTFNPPTNAAGRWVLDFFAPWLDDRHPNPAEPGELRWFTTLRGRDMEVPDARPFVMFRGEALHDFDPADFGAEKIVTPRSRTFVPSRVTDNFFYLGTGYIDTLQAMPEPLRSQMLDGDFTAGVEDDDWQAIPTAWIDAAMARWRPREAGMKGEMDSMGVDVAVGGRDAFVIACRHGAWFDALIRIPGVDIPQVEGGPITAGHVIRHRRDRAVVHVDVIGWGLTTANFLTENEVQTVAINAAVSSPTGSADGRLKFANVRAEMVWRMREALDPAGADPVTLPQDPALRADLAAYQWRATPRGILVRSKDEMKAILGRSPDAGDAVCLANFRTMKQEIWEDLRRERGRSNGSSWGGDETDDPYRDLREDADDYYRGRL